MQNIHVDEVEMEEESFLLELISTILQLSYTLCCEDRLWETIASTCEGCEKNLPSQKHHQCLMLEEEEAWNLFYDEATQTVDSNRLWDLASQVCEMLDFKLHPSWFVYVTEFSKLPWTTVYLTLLQFQICSRSEQTFESRTHELEIMAVLSKGPMNIQKQRKTILKASKVCCPEEFRRKDIEH